MWCGMLLLLFFYVHLLDRLGLSSAWKRWFEDVVEGYKLLYRVSMGETVKRSWMGDDLDGPSYEGSVRYALSRDRWY